MKIKVNCRLCGNEFETVESRIKNGRGKFCSRECYYKNGKTEETKVLIKSSMIGKRNSPNTEFKKGIIPWIKGKKNPSKYKGVARPQFRGKNSPSWRGGQKRYKHTTSRVEYIQWRKSVFERDNFTCQGSNCGKRGCYLEAHHIKSWAKYPELRFEINNGLTLCLDCHKKTHNYKGKNI